MEKRGIAYVENLLREVYLIADPGIIKVIAATVISNRLPFKPVWLFLIAPSGGGKTQFITALENVKGIHPLSAVTGHTFISGQKKTGKETSLLFQIKDGILTFKDFTTTLSLQRDERQEIMSQLREIYDGSYSRAFGTGQTINWKGKIGLIAGVTYAIHNLRELYAAMGERFVMYAIIEPERVEVSRVAVDHEEEIISRHPEIQEAFRAYFDEEIKIPEKIPKLDTNLREEILALAEFSTRARSPITRDWKTQEITDVHPAEMPTRFAAQLSILGRAMVVMNRNDGIADELLDTDKHILYKISLDSINYMRRKCLQKLVEYEEVETAGLAVKMNFPTATVRRHLEDLNVLEIVDRIKRSGRDRWKLKLNYRAILEKFEGISMLAPELTEAMAEKDYLPPPEPPKEEEEEIKAEELPFGERE